MTDPISSARPSDLIRSAADLVVLSVLADGPLYGYAISKQVAARSEGAFKLGPGVLYPLLHQMEQDGLLLAHWDKVQAEGGVSEGRSRKWYRLSAKGRRRLAKRIEGHRAYQALIESFLPSRDRGEARG